MTRRRISSLAAISLVILTASVAAAAADPTTVNPGVKIGQWVYENVAALFAPILAAVSLYYLAKRQFTKFISFAAFAILAALLIFGANEFKDFGVSLGKWFIAK
ncbi:MAG TPA: hypothetical protein VD969_23315 [Symbiobacteriaceae bacterium]|nr:hypothetical protein [Symbiobacteriaceae bacterium]